MTDYFVNSTEAKLSHDLSECLSIVEEVDDMLRAAFELLAKIRILSSNTDEAHVNVAILGDEAVTELEFLGALVKTDCVVYSHQRIAFVKGGSSHAFTHAGNCDAATQAKVINISNNFLVAFGRLRKMVCE